MYTYICLPFLRLTRITLTRLLQYVQKKIRYISFENRIIRNPVFLFRELFTFLQKIAFKICGKTKRIRCSKKSASSLPNTTKSLKSLIIFLYMTIEARIVCVMLPAYIIMRGDTC